jgi:predicted GNAT family N-acyltransferase
LRIIEPASPCDFQQYYELRWKILRAPWNQPRGSERDSRDADSSHLMMIDNRDVAVAVARLHFNSIREAQIRYMAVAVEQQRRG